MFVMVLLVLTGCQTNKQEKEVVDVFETFGENEEIVVCDASEEQDGITYTSKSIIKGNVKEDKLIGYNLSTMRGNLDRLSEEERTKLDESFEMNQSKEAIKKKEEMKKKGVIMEVSLKETIFETLMKVESITENNLKEAGSLISISKSEQEEWASLTYIPYDDLKQNLMDSERLTCVVKK